MIDGIKTMRLVKTLAIFLEIGVWGLALAVPLYFSHPQFLVGTLVNAILIFTAARLPVRSWLPVAVFPSFGALMHGALFGPATMFLVYFLPVIWIANLILMKVISLDGPSFGMNLLAGALIKAGLLFLAAKIYFSYDLVPVLFLTTMGSTQVFTALAGGIIAKLVILLIGSRDDGH